MILVIFINHLPCFSSTVWILCSPLCAPPKTLENWNICWTNELMAVIWRLFKWEKVVYSHACTPNMSSNIILHDINLTWRIIFTAEAVNLLRSHSYWKCIIGYCYLFFDWQFHFSIDIVVQFCYFSTSHRFHFWLMIWPISPYSSIRIRI